jgi:hypothetical protein
MTGRPDDGMTLGEARGMLEDALGDGVHCALCGQYARLYRRRINAGMAYSLILIYQRGARWVHVPTEIGARSREEGKLAYWGFLEEETTARPDGGRAGWWRITDTGAGFVRGEVKAREYALVYDGKCLGFDGGWVTIQDAIRDRFDYAALMARVEWQGDPMEER